MIRKLVVCAAALAFVFSLSVSAGISKAASNPGPETMVLKTGNATKPANFSHKKHQATIKCAECHHLQGADGKQVPWTEGKEIQKCVTCHSEATMKNPKLNSFKNAAHENCKECHKKEAAAGKAAAPTKCTGCHPKNK